MGVEQFLDTYATLAFARMRANCRYPESVFAKKEIST
jgi:hypothetical protein